MTSILKVSTVKDPTNSNTALSIDTIGRITTPARPAFRVYGTSAAWAALTSNTKLSLLTTVDYNIGNYYSTTDHEFSVPVAGLYHFSGRIYVNNTVTLSSYFISIDNGSMDGSRYFAGQDANQSDMSITFSETLQLTANQTVSIKGNNGQYLPVYCGFGGYLVG